MNFPKIQTPRSSLILICTLAVFAAAVAACGTSGGAPVSVTGTTIEKISSTLLAPNLKPFANSHPMLPVLILSAQGPGTSTQIAIFGWCGVVDHHG